jgi:hypothetical protein
MQFEIGGRYRNRKGWYEVLAIHAGKLVARYDDGTEARLNPEMQRGIIGNIAKDEARVTPYPAGDARQQGWARTIGILAASARLEAEVPPKSAEGFQRAYAESTGDNSVWQSPTVYLLEEGVDKWGSELRIYFPKSIVDDCFVLPAGVSVVKGFSPNEMRINDNGYWWSLVRDLGFRVGAPQDIASIRTRMPENLRTAFDEGIGALS